MAHAVGRPRRRSESAAGRFAAPLAVGVFVILSVYLVVTLLVIPRVRINRIYVQADFPIDKAVLLAMAGLDGSEQFFEFDTRAIEVSLEKNDYIRSASVSKTFPNQAKIVLTRRRPLVLAMDGEPGEAIRVGVVDEEGVLFELCPAGKTVPEIPVLSGMTFASFSVGTQLPPIVAPLLKDLYDLRADHPEIFSLFSEFEVVPLRGGGFDVRMYPRTHSIPILVGSEVDADLCTFVLMVVDALDQEGLAGRISQLDFRAGEVVYRLKEDTVVE